MSEILNEININDYNVQKMQGNGGGGGTEDLSVVLSAQDTALSTQETKIAQAIQALADKKSIDLAEETSDATATANDIKQGKTAYANGIKVEGSLEVTEKAVLPDLICFMSSQSTNFDWLLNVDMSNVERGWSLFENCYAMINAPQIDTKNFYTAQRMFYGCTKLQNVPVYDMSGIGTKSGEIGVISYMFQNCRNLSNESLNNIMNTCISATLHAGAKTLKEIGLTSAQATTCQTLSNWDAFVAAGWTSGY